MGKADVGRIISRLSRRLRTMSEYTGTTQSSNENAEVRDEAQTKRFLSVIEAARYLNLGKSTLYRMLQEGRIPCRRSSDGKKAKYIIFIEELEQAMRCD